MSDTGGGGEPDTSGGRRFSFGRNNRRGGVGAGVNLGDVAAQAKEFEGLAKAIDSVTKSLLTLSQKSGGYATTIAKDLNKVAGAMGGSGAPAGSTPNSNMYAAQRAQIPTMSGAPGSSEPPPATGRPGAFATAGAWLGTAAGSDLVSSVAMTPLRFIRDRLQTNRNVVMSASNALNMTGLRAGVGQEQTLDALGKNIGGVKGTAAELIALLQSAGPLGASYGFGNAVGQGVRGAGYFQGVQEAQVLNPGASVQSIAGAIGGQAANTASQQQSMMMTGGAYSMIGGGGRQKSLTEWADSIMKWLVDLRPGEFRGQKFSYGQLMSQYYPGSNIDAWFNVNGVSQEMREYWWTYELGKLSGAVGQDEKGIFQTAYPTAGGVGPTGGRASQKNNLAALRLESTNAMTQGEFAIGSKLSGAYGNREQSNRAFNEMIQSFLAQALPGALASGPLASLQYMPDMIEDLLMGLLERAPNEAQTLVGAGALGSMFLAGMGGDGGDVGDMPGSYGAMGGTTTSGMHPDMRRKIGAMQRANPRIKITSGLRDTGLQQRLKAKGHKNVSGKASAHTRGMAADLGPRSEYGWIAANASKFGLKSGKGQGEPWHVGMGDVGDWEDNLNAIKGIFSADSNDAASMFGMMQKVLDLIGQGLGADGSSGPAFDPGLYGTLQSKMREGISKQTYKPSYKGGSGGGTTVIGGQGSGSGAAAAVALFNAGFKKREDLTQALAIAKRESGWDADAENANGEDKGLMQINRKAHAARISRLRVNNLLDPVQNARVAYDIFSGSGNFMAWNFSEKSVQWGQPYRPGWAPADNQKRGGGYASPFVRTDIPEAAQIVTASGLPVGDMPEYTTPMSGSTTSGKNVVFYNTFNVQGGGVTGNGGALDVRRSVSVMADHLENEMKQRLARSN